MKTTTRAIFFAGPADGREETMNGIPTAIDWWNIAATRQENPDVRQ